MLMKRGEVYRYNYLWSHQHQRKEISGRKVRPVCLVVRSQRTPADLFLFPLTSQPPGDRLALAVPENELYLAALRSPCWIILDEYNVLSEGHLYDFDSLSPLGTFSLGFMRKIAGAISAATKQHRLRSVRRD